MKKITVYTMSVDEDSTRVFTTKEALAKAIVEEAQEIMIYLDEEKVLDNINKREAMNRAYLFENDEDMERYGLFITVHKTTLE